MEEPKMKILTNGNKVWRLSDRKLHRENGPAFINIAGYKSYWKYGERHREDGPAIILLNGLKKWYLNGEEYTEEEFKRHQLIIQLA